jgi:hypothetical protein
MKLPLTEDDILNMDWSTPVTQTKITPEPLQLTKAQIKQQHFEKASENERKKMMQLFKQFGITQFDFTSVKGHDRVDGYYTGKTGNDFLKLKQEQMMQVFTYSTVIEKSKLEFILNETKILNINH